MSTVRIFRINVEDLSTLQRIAEVYCRIWEEPPWNESFWEVDSVVEDIRRELSRTNGAGFFAELDGIVVGFTWGYELDVAELRTIVGSDSLDQLYKNQSRVFYIDELGVSSAVRSKGVGRRLSENLIESAGQVGCNVVTLRTDVAAEAAKILYARLGFEDLNIFDEKYPNRTYWLLRL